MHSRHWIHSKYPTLNKMDGLYWMFVDLKQLKVIKSIYNKYDHFA